MIRSILSSRTRVLLYTLISLSFTAVSQTGSIKGIVKDKDNGFVLDNVFISALKTNYHVHSTDKGLFFITDLTYSKYTLEIVRSGYKKQRLEVELSSDTTFVEINLESKYINLNEVAVAIDRPVSAASSSYLSQLSFINRPKNSAQDLLRLVPGLFIAQHAGGGKAEQIFVRGFDCDHGTDIATYVDGMPVNMPGHGHGQGYADLHFLIPEVVEGMSIFKGTSSPYYGDFATGAAINFKTLDSLHSNLLQVENSSVPQNRPYSGSRGLALLKVPLSNNNVSSYFAMDLLGNQGYFEKDQQFRRMNLFSKTTIALNEFSKISFSASGFGSSWNASGQIPERAVHQKIISRFGNIDPNEGGTTQRNNFNLSYSTKTTAGEFETQAYAFTYRFKLFSNFTFFLEDSVHGDMIEQGDSRTVKGLNTKYSLPHKLFSKQNKFTIGGSLRSDEIENQLWHAPKQQRIEAKAHAMIHQNSYGVYANELFRLSSRLRLEAGIRYDYFIFDVDDLIPSDSTHRNYSGYNFQQALSPKLNLIYSINDKTQLFFNTGRGFHSNDARSVVQDKNNHSLPLALSAEAGTLLRINKLVISAAFWAMDLGNELVYVGDDGTTENKGSSRRMGIDASLRMRVFSWLYADADINFAQAFFTDTLFGNRKKEDAYIPLAPIFTSTGGLTAKFKTGFELALRYRHMSNRPANESNTVIAHGYTVTDLTANYKTSRYRIGVSIENLFNVKWNEAQFNTKSRLQNENQPVEELHFTPGTPFSIKTLLTFYF